MWYKIREKQSAQLHFVNITDQQRKFTQFVIVWTIKRKYSLLHATCTIGLVSTGVLCQK